MTSTKICCAALTGMVLGAVAPAGALYLDDDKDFKLTAVLYSQARVRIPKGEAGLNKAPD